MKTSKIDLPQAVLGALLPEDFKEFVQEAFLSGHFSSLSSQALEETAGQFVELISSNIYEWPLLGRATFTGAAACWALQHLGVKNWQQTVEEGGSPSEVLDTFLEQSVLESSMGDLEERVNIVKDRYDFPTLSENVHNLMARHSIENVRQGYKDALGAVIKISVDDSGSYKESIWGTPYWDVSEQRIYYRNAYIATRYGNLLFGNNLPWILIDKDYMEIKVPSVQTTVYVDGASFSVAKSTEDPMTYTELEIKDESQYFFSLLSMIPGSNVKILKDGSRIEIDTRKESIQLGLLDL